MEFFNQTGKMAIGSRLRLLTQTITENASGIYKLYGVDLKPKWFPVYTVLSKGEPRTITSIAREIGHSHPSVSNIVRELVENKIVEEFKDESDGRRTLVGLTSRGMKMMDRLAQQCVDVNGAVEKIIGQTQHDLWKAIEEWECLLSEKSLLHRVLDEKRMRERRDIAIVTYESRFREVFRSLNEEWIKKYFTMEEADYLAINHPEEHILEKSGHIFVALYKNDPVGVCALLQMNDGHYDFELAKLAVSPAVQGMGIGFLLGKACVEKAKELGGKKLYLESNTILEPAIHIYRKLGFKEVTGHLTPYQRCNIQMELLME